MNTRLSDDLISSSSSSHRDIPTPLEFDGGYRGENNNNGDGDGRGLEEYDDEYDDKYDDGPADLFSQPEEGGGGGRCDGSQFGSVPWMLTQNASEGGGDVEEEEGSGADDDDNDDDDDDDGPRDEDGPRDDAYDDAKVGGSGGDPDGAGGVDVGEGDNVDVEEDGRPSRSPAAVPSAPPGDGDDGGRGAGGGRGTPPASVGGDPYRRPPPLLPDFVRSDPSPSPTSPAEAPADDDSDGDDDNDNDDRDDDGRHGRDGRTDAGIGETATAPTWVATGLTEETEPPLSSLPDPLGRTDALHHHHHTRISSDDQAAPTMIPLRLSGLFSDGTSANSSNDDDDDEHADGEIRGDRAAAAAAAAVGLTEETDPSPWSSGPSDLSGRVPDTRQTDATSRIPMPSPPTAEAATGLTEETDPPPLSMPMSSGAGGRYSPRPPLSSSSMSSPSLPPGRRRIEGPAPHIRLPDPRVTLV